MSNQVNPNEAPPPYSQDPSGHLAVPEGSTQGVGQSSSPRHRRTPSSGSTASSNYTSDDDRDDSDIPEEQRRELIDVERPLPEGWRRCVASPRRLCVFAHRTDLSMHTGSLT